MLLTLFNLNFARRVTAGSRIYAVGASSRSHAAPAKVGAQFTGDARHDLDVVARADLELRAALDKALAMLTGCEG